MLPARLGLEAAKRHGLSAWNQTGGDSVSKYATTTGAHVNRRLRLESVNNGGIRGGAGVTLVTRVQIEVGTEFDSASVGRPGWMFEMTTFPQLRTRPLILCPRDQTISFPRANHSIQQRSTEYCLPRPTCVSLLLKPILVKPLDVLVSLVFLYARRSGSQSKRWPFVRHSQRADAPRTLHFRYRMLNEHSSSDAAS
jgi:hypothetical protein